MTTKTIFWILAILILSQAVFAEEVFSNYEDEECGITNIASCIPQKIFEFIIVMLNAPILPLLFTIKKLLTTEVSISLFHHAWSIIRYILGFFYIFLFVYSGYVFLTSNADPIKRFHAKEMLKNTIIMIILIQGSFYLYKLVLNLSSILNKSILQIIDPRFFLITTDSMSNIGLEFIFAMGYAFTLFITMIMLTIRYIIVSFGVILVPIGIFCYFIPPLKTYGKFIIHMLGILMFITFIDLLIILTCSMLTEISLFRNTKILIMITCFGIINYTLYLAVRFAMTRSSEGSLKEDIGQAAKYITMLA